MPRVTYRMNKIITHRSILNLFVVKQCLYVWTKAFYSRDIITWRQLVCVWMFPRMVLCVAGSLVFFYKIRRSTVIIEGGIHAREWIAPAFVTYMIHQILHSPEGDDDKLRDIAMTYEWYFIPCLNPDGYEYSHKQVCTFMFFFCIYKILSLFYYIRQ